MKVKNIYFSSVVPGQPIYEMEDGEVRIPFPDGKTNAMLWCTQDECLLALTKKNPETQNIVISQFVEMRKLINTKDKEVKRRFGIKKKIDIKEVN